MRRNLFCSIHRAILLDLCLSDDKPYCSSPKNAARSINTQKYQRIVWALVSLEEQ